MMTPMTNELKCDRCRKPCSKRVPCELCGVLLCSDCVDVDHYPCTPYGHCVDCGAPIRRDENAKHVAVRCDACEERYWSYTDEVARDREGGV